MFTSTKITFLSRKYMSRPIDLSPESDDPCTEAAIGISRSSKGALRSHQRSLALPVAYCVRHRSSVHAFPTHLLHMW